MLQDTTPNLIPLMVDHTQDTYIFKKLFTGKEFFLSDHQVNHIPTLPGVAYLEMVRAATATISKQPVASINGVIWAYPIQIIDKKPQELFIVLKKTTSGLSFEVTTKAENKCLLHARGKINLERSTIPERLDLDAIKKRCIEKLCKDEIYKNFDNIGLNYGLSFRMIEDLYYHENEVLSLLQIPTHLLSNTNEFVLHPIILDGSIQTVFTAQALLTKLQTLYLPFSISQIEIFKNISTSSMAYGILSSESKEAQAPKFQIQIINEDGDILINIKNFVARVLQKK